MIGRKELAQLLKNGGKVVADNLLSFKKAVDASDSISLTIQAERKRFGGEVHLVVPPNSILAVGGS
jgi:hypothetical protein